MTKSARSVPKLKPRVPGVPAVHAGATKRRLVDVAEELFTEQGYAATSLDAVVAGAKVTKGAFYHHFAGKAALFETVFERVEADAAKRIKKSLRDRRDPWEKARTGLRAFLDVVQEPRYRRIVIQEGPSVLGYERFREMEERSTYPTIVEIARAVLAAGSWTLDDAMLDTFARIFFGAMSSAGETVTSADDTEEAAQRVEDAIGLLLSGVQSLVESGTDLTTVFDATSGS